MAGTGLHEHPDGRASLPDALRWIVTLLGTLGAPYQVVGGLAARAYGSPRPLIDIDLYVPDADLARIAAAAASHVERPPAHHLDAHWDLTFMKLRWEGWTIEVAGADSAHVWDRGIAGWRPVDVDFSGGHVGRVEGVEMSIMPRSQLVEYKRGLGREVDDLDLAALGSQELTRD